MNWSKEIGKMNGWSFGDSPAMADALVRLVLDGKKTGTSSLLMLYEIEGGPVPRVGDRSFIKDSMGKPVCVIEVNSVEMKRFKDVDATFARSEGEGDLSLSYWQEVHRKFFEKSYSAFDEEMMVVCESFTVLHRF